MSRLGSEYMAASNNASQNRLLFTWFYLKNFLNLKSDPTYKHRVLSDKKIGKNFNCFAMYFQNLQSQHGTDLRCIIHWAF